jgi:alkylation response protein AidB-like acyl-CoA dehydrogenase
MDFNFTEEQEMLGNLAGEIFQAEVTDTRLKQIDNQDRWFDDALWKQLAEADLLGIPVPEAQGGMGYGILELCVLLEQQGRALAPVPLLPTLVMGALPIAKFGSPQQQQDYLPAVAAGELMLTAALEEPAGQDPLKPSTKAVRDGDGYKLSGIKHEVPAVDLAQRIIIPAQTAEGVRVFLVDPAAPGLRTTKSRTSTGEPLFLLELADVPVGSADLLGDAENGRETLEWIYQSTLAALCLLQVGVSERTLEMTADYVRERVQFGVPVGSFQAVQQRCADGYIDVAAMRWSAWRAAWLLEEGRSASDEIAIAKFWAADAGSRIANSAMHLHAGIGVDLDYPIHRYFLWAKALELMLGGAAPQLSRLGTQMAANPPQDLQEVM